jgi:hypothetical protein
MELAAEGIALRLGHGIESSIGGKGLMGKRL